MVFFVMNTKQNSFVENWAVTCCSIFVRVIGKIKSAKEMRFRQQATVFFVKMSLENDFLISLISLAVT